MPDRLVELHRQRALLQEHLAWLEREIAAESDQSDAATVQPPASTAIQAPAPFAPLATTSPLAGPTAAATARRVDRSTSPTSDADVIIEQYRASPGSLQSDVRKGCFLYFAAAFVLLGVGVVALYFLISSR